MRNRDRWVRQQQQKLGQKVKDWKGEGETDIGEYESETEECKKKETRNEKRQKRERGDNR